LDLPQDSRSPRSHTARRVKTSKTPTGQRIVLELVKEMQAGLYPLFYRTLAPSLYHVHLHPDDYREIEGVTSLIVLDAQKALTGRVNRLNRRSRLSKFLFENSAVEAPAGGWEIHIHADANGELERGELGIVSRLSVPAAPHYEGGTPTARIVRTVVTSTARRSVASDETVPPPPIPTPAEPIGIRPQAAPVTETAKRLETPAPEAEAFKGFARLAYVDEQGPHVYAIKKDVISIGRGGREHWVDVQLVTSPRVSREHCRIRRDDQGRFFLHDLSTWGTSIDGKPVRPAATSDDVSPPGAHEQELPRQARIQLADAVVIEFQAQPSS
jgi:FHA domain-containing protein